MEMSGERDRDYEEQRYRAYLSGLFVLVNRLTIQHFFLSLRLLNRRVWRRSYSAIGSIHVAFMSLYTRSNIKAYSPGYFETQEPATCPRRNSDCCFDEFKHSTPL